MKKRFCGIELGRVLEGIRPVDDVRLVATYTLEEAVAGDLPYHVLKDDGARAARYCVLILGRLGSDFHFATLDGPKGSGQVIPDIPIALIRKAVAMIPDGREGRGQLQRVIASRHATAGMLLVAQTPAGAMNCAFARNPALDHDDAARLLKAYFTETVSSWTGKN